MKRRDFNSLYVAEMRYVQALHEKGELRNPDRLVECLIPMLRRWRCAWLGQSKLAALRSDPFYYYLVGRTRYYDQVFLDAIAQNVRVIINLGCGTDTRAYRFEHVLRQNGVKVLECDLPLAIRDKQQVMRTRGGIASVDYLPIDLNDETWPDLEKWMIENKTSKGLVLMEGVSPYVNVNTFTRFLRFLASELTTGSRVAYDFKIRGVSDEFGLVGRTREPFRLPWDKKELDVYHAQIGFQLHCLEHSSELTTRLLTGLKMSGMPLFSEDALIQIEVVR